MRLHKIFFLFAHYLNSEYQIAQGEMDIFHKNLFAFFTITCSEFIVFTPLTRFFAL
jgi:hypothetical protein